MAQQNPEDNSSPPSRRLGARQMELLQVLWDLGEATARDITEEINRRAAPGAPVTAHSTVQTQLRELEAKNVVGYRKEERSFIFFPTVARGEVALDATRDLLTRLFEGSPLRLMTHLLQHERLTREDLDRLRGLIEEQRADAQTPNSPEKEDTRNA